MQHWTPKRKASFIIHALIVSVPFTFSTASAVLFWHNLFQSWLVAVPMVAVLDVLALIGLVLYIVQIESPFVHLRHTLPIISIVPLGLELYTLLEHNGVYTAVLVASIATAVLVAIAWQCFRTIERLFIDPVVAAREKAQAQLKTLAIAQAQLLETRAITEQFVQEWQRGGTARRAVSVQPVQADAPRIASEKTNEHVPSSDLAYNAKALISTTDAPSIAAHLTALGVRTFTSARELAKHCAWGSPSSGSAGLRTLLDAGAVQRSNDGLYTLVYSVQEGN